MNGLRGGLMATIEIKKVSKSFPDPMTLLPKKPLLLAGSKKAQIDNLSMTIEDGKTVVILGPSGCGKTTLLKIIAGLLPPDKGSVTFDGVPIEEIPMRERRIGMVFQNYALYPNFSAKKNMLTWFLFKRGQKNLDLDDEAQAKLEKTAKLLDVSIEHLYNRMPRQLSGGEKQRVALGRCITRTPALFLMDEPFSNLDQILRQKYREHLKLLLREFAITTVYVTHDQHEALLLADRIAVMNAGVIEQFGTFEELYTNPASLFVATFLNPLHGVPALNTLPGELLDGGVSGVISGFRPQNILVDRNLSAYPNTANIMLAEKSPFSDDLVLTLNFKGESVCAVVSGHDSFERGDEVSFKIKEQFQFDATSGENINRRTV